MNIKPLSPSEIGLFLQNPRHRELASEDQVIVHLFENEKVFALVKDIAANGLNLLQNFAVIPNNLDSAYSYTAVDGNRRLCALKVLEDPEKAPKSYRKAISELSKSFQLPERVNAIIFSNFETAKIWLERTHGGELSGAGPKKWGTEQKQRFSDNSKNRAALQIVDFARSKGILDENKDSKLTTVTRYIHVPEMQAALGIEIDEYENVTRNVKVAYFVDILTKFFEKLLDPIDPLPSQTSNEAIEAFASTLTKPRSKDQISSGSSLAVKAAGSSGKKIKPKKPKPPYQIDYSGKIQDELNRISNYKLLELYDSLHKVSARAHCQLVTVGVWSFFEAVCNEAGKKGTTDFKSYLDGLMKKEPTYQTKNGSMKRKDISDAVKYIQSEGNLTKHNGIGGTYDTVTLISKVKMAEPALLLALRKI